MGVVGVAPSHRLGPAAIAFALPAEDIRQQTGKAVRQADGCSSGMGAGADAGRNAATAGREYGGGNGAAAGAAALAPAGPQAAGRAAAGTHARPAAAAVAAANRLSVDTAASEAAAAAAAATAAGMGGTAASAEAAAGAGDAAAVSGAAGAADAGEPAAAAAAVEPPGAILLPKGYGIKEGAPLWDGVRLGRLLGAGSQAKVFELESAAGAPLQKVLKINHQDLGSKMLNNNVVWVGMDREWEIGTQVRAALQEADGKLPGFLSVLECVVRDDPLTGRARFSGMILEELHGCEVYKRIDTPSSTTYTTCEKCCSRCFLPWTGPSASWASCTQTWACATSWSTTQAPGAGAASGSDSAAQQPQQHPGYNCNIDGSRLPLGPEVEFKIIDFGLAKLSPKLAAAAGGRESQEVMRRLQHTFGPDRRLKFGHSDQKTRMVMKTEDASRDQGWLRTIRERLLPTGGQHKFSVRRRQPAAAAGSSDSSENSSSHSAHPSSAADAAQAGSGTVAAEAAVRPERLLSFASMRSLSQHSAPRVAATKHSHPPAGAPQGGSSRRQRRGKLMSPIETIYRQFWHRKGDVFHLLLGMSLVLDDRVWPEEDEAAVEALCSLVHHVTGIQMEASFVEPGEGAPRSLLGKLACGSRPLVVGEDSGDYGRWGKWYHFFKRWHFRLKAHILPFNSGLLAGEALVHPFFGAGRVQHATLPAGISRAFPPTGHCCNGA